MAENKFGGRKCFLSSDTVEVLIGPQKTSFRIHRNLLHENWPFLDGCVAARIAGAKKSSEARPHLPDEDPVAFSAMVDWIYTSSLNEIQKHNAGENLGTDECLFLVKVYCAALRFRLSPLNKAIERVLDEYAVGDCDSLDSDPWGPLLREIIENVPSSDLRSHALYVLAWGFVNTSTGGQLRKLTATWFTRFLKSDHDDVVVFVAELLAFLEESSFDGRRLPGLVRNAMLFERLDRDL